MGPLPFQRQIQVIFRAPASQMPSTGVTNPELTLPRAGRALAGMLGVGSRLCSEALLCPLMALWLCHITSLCPFPHLKMEVLTPTQDCCDGLEHVHEKCLVNCEGQS